MALFFTYKIFYQILSIANVLSLIITPFFVILWILFIQSLWHDLIIKNHKKLYN